MQDEPQGSSKKRKTQINGPSTKKPPSKKSRPETSQPTLNDTATRPPLPSRNFIRSKKALPPTPDNSTSRRPLPQKNATPGPSRLPAPDVSSLRRTRSSITTSSSKKRPHSPDSGSNSESDDDQTPPPVSTLRQAPKSRRLRKGDLPSIVAKSKPKSSKPKNKRKPPLKKCKTLGAPTEVIELFSSSEEETRFTRRHSTQNTPRTRAPAPPDAEIIDLCSDDDDDTPLPTPALSLLKPNLPTRRSIPPLPCNARHSNPGSALPMETVGGSDTLPSNATPEPPTQDFHPSPSPGRTDAIPIPRAADPNPFESAAITQLLTQPSPADPSLIYASTPIPVNDDAATHHLSPSHVHDDFNIPEFNPEEEDSELQDALRQSLEDSELQLTISQSLMMDEDDVENGFYGTALSDSIRNSPIGVAQVSERPETTDPSPPSEPSPQKPFISLFPEEDDSDLQDALQQSFKNSKLQFTIFQSLATNKNDIEDGYEIVLPGSTQNGPAGVAQALKLPEMTDPSPPSESSLQATSISLFTPALDMDMDTDNESERENILPPSLSRRKTDSVNLPMGAQVAGNLVDATNREPTALFLPDLNYETVVTSQNITRSSPIREEANPQTDENDEDSMYAPSEAAVATPSTLHSLHSPTGHPSPGKANPQTDEDTDDTMYAPGGAAVATPSTLRSLHSPTGQPTPTTASVNGTAPLRTSFDELLKGPFGVCDRPTNLSPVMDVPPPVLAIRYSTSSVYVPPLLTPRFFAWSCLPFGPQHGAGVSPPSEAEQHREAWQPSDTSMIDGPKTPHTSLAHAEPLAAAEHVGTLPPPSHIYSPLVNPHSSPLPKETEREDGTEITKITQELLESDPSVVAALEESRMFMEILKNIQRQPRATSHGNDSEKFDLEVPSANQPEAISTGSLSPEANHDSCATLDDSPSPPTPQNPHNDTSLFYIRSSSPVEANIDSFNGILDIPLPPLSPAEKDDDAYLLTHCFDYPDMVN